jgi:hypothetical protein
MGHARGALVAPRRQYAADHLYWLLRSYHGVGRTTVYKLITRKQPHLLTRFREQPDPSGSLAL